MVHNSENEVAFFLKLYSAVIPVDFDKIKIINDHPRVNMNPTKMIIEIASEKFDRGTINRLWLNKGFSSKGDDLEDWHVGIPDNLYTLKLIYIDNDTRGVEEFFNETDYDERKKVQKDL